MNNFFRALIAGYGAKKLGGGCFGTVIVFIIIWVALGQCSWRTLNDSQSENHNDRFIDTPIERFVDETRLPVESTVVLELVD
jgi:hypothetical protein